MTVRYSWSSHDRDLEIRLRADADIPDPVDLHWHFGHLPDDDERRAAMVWRRPFVDEMMHKMSVAGGTQDATLRHAVEPLVRYLNPTLIHYRSDGDRPATTAAHDLITLWLTSAFGTDTELAAAYERATLLFNRQIWTDEEFWAVARVVLHQLRVDAARIPPDLVARLLTRLLPPGGGPPPRTVVYPAVDAALAALKTDPDPADAGTLLDTIRNLPEFMIIHGSPPEHLLAALISAHTAGVLTQVMDRPIAPLLERLVDEAPDTPTYLRRQARQIAAAMPALHGHQERTPRQRHTQCSPQDQRRQ